MPGRRIKLATRVLIPRNNQIAVLVIIQAQRAGDHFAGGINRALISLQQIKKSLPVAVD
jgi:hypothetical protein